MPTNDRNTPQNKPKDEKVRDLPERKVSTEKEAQVKGGARRPQFDADQE